VQRPHAPLFAPLAFACSAQIEALDPRDLVQDATRLGKHLSGLRRLLGTEAIVCAVPACMEAEALGAEISFESWPPRLVDASPVVISDADIDPQALLRNSPRLRASLETVKRTAVADQDEPVLIAALTGPATLSAQLRAAQGASEEALHEFAGRALAMLVRLFAEAGADLVIWHETNAPAEEMLWREALGTACNVARFHRVPTLLVAASNPATASWPSQAIPCPTLAQAPLPASRLQGRAWPADPAKWPALPTGNACERFITTAGEIPAGSDLAELRRHALRIRGVEMT
jgi:acetophenone carboxylase